MKKVLVTGATGFVGANLVRALVNIPGMEVHITARTSSDFWRLKEIIPLIHEIHYVNLEERNPVFQMMEKVKPEIIYHISTYGGFPNQIDHELIIKSNLYATIHLLDSAVLYGVKQFINTGSSSEYGTKNEPMRETDKCQPCHLYGITKLAATHYCSMIANSTNIRICTLRLFSVYGPYEDTSRLYPSIREALLNNERPRLSKPDSVRDFIPIDRVVKIYLNIISADYVAGDVYNVGSGKQKTIEEFYTLIAQELDKSHLVPIWGEAPPRKHEPKVWEADMSKLAALLNLRTV